MTRGAHHGGGVLFEVLLSIALFAGAAVFTLGTTQTVLVALDRSGRDALALDLARAKMAELEAGLVTVAELRESADGLDRAGSIELRDATEIGDPLEPIWILDVRSERSEFTGLTLVEITVEEDTPVASTIEGDADPSRARATLRQLIALRDDDAGEEYEEDALIRDLPDAPEGPP